MISPGEFHRSVPRDPMRNRLFRQATLIRCKKDLAFRKAVLWACEQDILFWVNTFVFQFNPNSIGAGSERVGPFVTWQFQDEAVRVILDCIDTRHDLLIEKSREMGASWLCLLVMLWAVLFRPWEKYLCISRDEKSVDRKGDSDSLFWKLDFVLTHLPDWMKNHVRRSKMLFKSNRTHTSITGQASTGKAGVGGRCTAMFIDEFSQIDADREVFARTSDTTGCRIFNGTHRGLDTAFYELSDPNSLMGSYVKKLQMHWTQHPDKVKGLYRSDASTPTVIDTTYQFPAHYDFVLDGTPTGGPFPSLRSVWYDMQVKRKGSTREAAMDLDIDAKGSTRQFFDALRIRDLGMDCTDPVWRGSLLYDRERARPDTLLEDDGLLHLWVHPDGKGRPPVGRYGIGCDPSSGVGATPTCLSILNLDTGEKVGEYRNAWIYPHDLATFLVALGWLFKDREGNCARLIWEVPGPGDVLGQIIMQLGYRNVWWRTNEMKLAHQSSDVPGWHNNVTTARVLLEDYRAALYSGAFTNRSKTALEECLNFEYTRNTVKHSAFDVDADAAGATVNHGDMCMADAMACKLGKAGRSKSKELPPAAPQVNSLIGRMKWHDQRRRTEEAL